MTPLAAMRQLRAVAAGLRDTGALGDLGLWLAHGLEVYAANAAAGDTLETVLGLDQPGAEAWWRTEARQTRDAAIRDIARRLGHREIAAHADHVRSELRRYARRWQRIDRYQPAMPAGYAGTIEELLFKTFEAGRIIGDVPDSPRQLHRILSACENERSPCHRHPPADVIRGVVSVAQTKHQRPSGRQSKV